MNAAPPATSHDAPREDGLTLLASLDPAMAAKALERIRELGTPAQAREAARFGSKILSGASKIPSALAAKLAASSLELLASGEALPAAEEAKARAVAKSSASAVLPELSGPTALWLEARTPGSVSKAAKATLAKSPDAVLALAESGALTDSALDAILLSAADDIAWAHGSAARRAEAEASPEKSRLRTWEPSRNAALGCATSDAVRVEFPLWTRLSERRPDALRGFLARWRRLYPIAAATEPLHLSKVETENSRRALQFRFIAGSEALFDFLPPPAASGFDPLPGALNELIAQDGSTPEFARAFGAWLAKAPDQDALWRSFSQTHFAGLAKTCASDGIFNCGTIRPASAAALPLGWAGPGGKAVQARRAAEFFAGFLSERPDAFRAAFERRDPTRKYDPTTAEPCSAGVAALAWVGEPGFESVAAALAPALRVAPDLPQAEALADQILAVASRVSADSRADARAAKALFEAAATYAACRPPKAQARSVAPPRL